MSESGSVADEVRHSRGDLFWVVLAAGVDRARVFFEHASGAVDSRPELVKLLSVPRQGDTLVVWRLDWLGLSKSHLINTVTELPVLPARPTRLGG